MHLQITGQQTPAQKNGVLFKNMPLQVNCNKSEVELIFQIPNINKLELFSHSLSTVNYIFAQINTVFFSYGLNRNVSMATIVF